MGEGARVALAWVVLCGLVNTGYVSTSHKIAVNTVSFEQEGLGSCRPLLIPETYKTGKYFSSS